VALRDILDKVITAAQAPGPLLHGLYVRNKLVEFLMQVIYYGRKKAVPEGPHPLKDILEHIAGHPDEKMSVDDLARMAGLSASRFKANFKRTLGVPPGEYVLRKKIERAQTLLSQGGKSVTDVAFDLDFSSSQYFATVFKRYTGKTPRMYLDKKKGVPE
jgi:AraC-like DNA-binding protein